MSNVVQEYFNNRTPENTELYNAFKRGEVDIFGNRRDAPGYSLASSAANPNLTNTSVIGQAPTQTTSTSTNTQADIEQASTPSDIMNPADVERLYQDVLDRKADPYGLEFYKGMSYAQAKKELEGSPEYLTNEYYKEKFGTPLTYEQRALFPADMSLADRYAKIDSFATPGGDTGGADTGGADTGGISTLPTQFDPTGAVPIDLGLERTFRGVVDRDPRQEDYDFYLKEYGDTFDFADRANLMNRLRAEQLQRFETQLGIPAATPSGPIQPTPALDFSSFGATPATAGIESLRPRDAAGNLISGTMASAFANPQFTSPYSVQTEQQQLPDTFTQLGSLFGEQFKEDIRGPLEEQIRAEVAEEAAGNRAGGLASLGYRRGGVVDENGIPRLFIGGLFKGIGRALKGITKIAPFVLPFIPGFQALSLPMQSLIAGGVGGFRDGKFDFKRALTSGLTTYGIGRLAQSAGASVTPESGGVGGGIQTAQAGVQSPTGDIVSGMQTGSSYYVPEAAAGQGIAAGRGITSTAPAISTAPTVDPQLTGLDRLKAEAVGTGQNILKTGQELVSGNIPMKELTTPALTTIGGITATKAGDEIAKQEAEYKALTAADAAEKERKRRLALDAMRRNPFGYNEGGVSSLPPRYLDGAGDGMSDSIRANIGGLQEARLADGEFVVPADVVADLGNGSSNAGAERLYSMMDRIRQARHGTTKQPPEVNVNKALPA